MRYRQYDSQSHVCVSTLPVLYGIPVIGDIWSSGSRFIAGKRILNIEIVELGNDFLKIKGEEQNRPLCSGSCL